ncbi:MAG TPA: DoxX family protein [Microlunatus sp.]|nr:DoxX family protein [Microlunatus sp.]
MLPEPIWPVVLLAVIQLADGIMCLKPVDFIARCLTNVRFPRRFWGWLSPLKFAAALGLLAGIWIPYLGVVTATALVLYFVVAVSMHVRAHDLGRDLFLNATGMLLICLATLVFSFLV